MADLISMLAACAGGGEKDPDFNQTVLLLHGDGTNGAQNNTFLDSSTNNFTITRNGNTTQGTFSPFSLAAGEWSNYFDGNGDYLSIADNAALELGSSNFTMECWVNFAALPPANGNQATFFSKWGSSQQSYEWYLYNDNGTQKLYLTYSTNGTNSTNVGNITWAPSIGVWYHIALVRNGSDLLFFVNGTQQGTTQSVSGVTVFNSSAPMAIGVFNTSTPTGYLNGYISNARLVVGSALYTTTFTPSTVPLTTTSQGASSSEVELLTCQSNRFVDNSTNAFAITRNGDVGVTPFSPFAPTAAYSAGTNGGSGYFNGSGGYLVTTSAAALAIGTSAFTLEGWCYFNNVNTVGAGFGTCAVSSDATGDRGVSLFLTGSGAWRFRIGRSVAGQLEDFLGTTTLTAGQWYHFKIVRTSTGSNDTRIYLNGVQEAIGTSTISLNMQKFSISNYAPSDTSVAILNGYVAGVRFTNTAESSAIPTAPPTAVSGTQYLVNFTNAGIIDNTGKNNLETVGNAQIDTAVKKFGTGSLEFDGTGDWLLVPDNPDIQLGTGPFTIEMWVYLASGDAGSFRSLVSKGASGTGWTVFLDTTEKVNLTYESSSITSSAAITTNAWNHIAVVREGTGSNQTKIYLNGTNDGTGTVATNFNQTNVMYVGAGRLAGTPMKGYIDDLRITKGIARTITVPTAAFPNE